MKFFTFADRFVPIQFFEEDPVKLTLKISDEMDDRLRKAVGKIAAADKLVDAEKRRRSYREALDELIGEENADRILSRADEADCFTIGAIVNYILKAYGDQKTKNLSASAR